MENRNFPNLQKEREVDSDTVLIVILVWMFFSQLFYPTINILTGGLNIEMFAYLNVGMSLIGSFIPVGLAYIIKDSTKRTPMMALSVLSVFVSLITSVYYFSQTTGLLDFTF